jgi:O-antigen ligase/polysaccharide polymerase Wzy-like membrane protein
MQQERVVRADGESVTEATDRRSATARYANSLAFFLLLLCLLMAPFPHGAVLPAGKLKIELLAFVTAALAFASRTADGRLGPAATTAATICGIGMLGVLQLLPLEPEFLRRLSPQSASIYAETNSLLRMSGQPPVAARISIAPTDTESTTLLTFAYAALFASAARLATTRRRRRVVAAALLAAAAGQVVISAAISGSEERMHGAFVNANHFAGYLQISLAFAFGILTAEIMAGPERSIQIRDRGERFERRAFAFAWRLLLWGVIAAGVALTRSRGGVLAAAFATLFMAAASLLRRPMSGRGRRIGGAIAAAALLGILFVLYTTGEAAILRFLASDPREIRTDIRMEIWNASMQAWHLFPTFGSGLGTFREAFRRFQPGDMPGLVEQAHSDFLQLLVTGGWVGAALGVIGFGSVFVLLLVRWWPQRQPEEAAITLSGIAALLSLTLHGIVEFNMSIPAIPATLAIMLGVSWATSASATEGFWGVEVADSERVIHRDLASIRQRVAPGLQSLIGWH